MEERDLAGGAVVIKLHEGESVENMTVQDMMDRRLVLVIDPSKSDPIMKLPCGRFDRNKWDDTVRETASREVGEETGLVRVHISNCPNHHIVDEMRNHDRHFFLGGTSEDLDQGFRGDENGNRMHVITRFTVRQVLERQVEILPPHLQVLERLIEQADSVSV